MARLYTNENFPLAVVTSLRLLGHDVLIVREASADNQQVSDEAVLAFAIAQQRALVTMNRRDFIRLHQQQPDHHGIVVCTQDSDTEGQARRIDAAIRAAAPLIGVLLRVNRPA